MPSSSPNKGASQEMATQDKEKENILEMRRKKAKELVNKLLGEKENLSVVGSESPTSAASIELDTSVSSTFLPQGPPINDGAKAEEDEVKVDKKLRIHVKQHLKRLTASPLSVFKSHAYASDGDQSPLLNPSSNTDSEKPGYVLSKIRSVGAPLGEGMCIKKCLKRMGSSSSSSSSSSVSSSSESSSSSSSPHKRSHKDRKPKKRYNYRSGERSSRKKRRYASTSSSSSSCSSDDSEVSVHRKSSSDSDSESSSDSSDYKRKRSKHRRHRSKQSYKHLKHSRNPKRRRGHSSSSSSTSSTSSTTSSSS